MKKVLVSILVALSLLAAALSAVHAEGAAPGPTPKPEPVAEGGVPAYSTALEGVDAAEWKESFLKYAKDHQIPVEDGGFAVAGEWARADMYADDKSGISEAELKMVDRMYRVMAGGVEVFLQVTDDKTALKFVTYLYYDSLSTEDLTETLSYYYPLVLRACIYAGEPDATEERAEALQKKLCPDIRWLVDNLLAVETYAESETAYYMLSSEDFYINTIGFWDESLLDG